MRSIGRVRASMSLMFSGRRFDLIKPRFDASQCVSNYACNDAKQHDRGIAGNEADVERKGIESSGRKLCAGANKADDENRVSEHKHGR
jgi:hypothetical protein